ncbi:MAG: T9SS type A sorting domain-containing protein [Lentimicrobiaceae bacterium]|nr:T9SS type A sorting domain-containing protein [Lentimicrobiaceae bacterium]
MKNFLTLVLVCISLCCYAQKFQLTDKNGNPYSDNQTISSLITENDLDYGVEFVTYIEVANLTDIDLNVKTLRTNINLVDGMNAYVCFFECDSPEGTMLEMEYTIEGGGSETYSLHLQPHGNFGLCRFKIEFEAEDQQMTLYVDIDMTHVGVQENNNAASLSAFPNPAPANSIITISYSLAHNNDSNRLIIRNILGTVVMNLPLNPFNSNISIDISSLKSGVYFYSIENNNQISITKKLIVK